MPALVEGRDENELQKSEMRITDGRDENESQTAEMRITEGTVTHMLMRSAKVVRCGKAISIQTLRLLARWGSWPPI